MLAFGNIYIFHALSSCHALSPVGKLKAQPRCGQKSFGGSQKEPLGTKAKDDWPRDGASSKK